MQWLVCQIKNGEAWVQNLTLMETRNMTLGHSHILSPCGCYENKMEDNVLWVPIRQKEGYKWPDQLISTEMDNQIFPALAWKFGNSGKTPSSTRRLLTHLQVGYYRLMLTNSKYECVCCGQGEHPDTLMVSSPR